MQGYLRMALGSCHPSSHCNQLLSILVYTQNMQDKFPFLRLMGSLSLRGALKKELGL